MCYIEDERWGRLCMKLMEWDDDMTGLAAGDSPFWFL